MTLLTPYEQVTVNVYSADDNWYNHESCSDLRKHV